MPSPVTEADFEISSFSGSICELLKKLLALNTTLKEFFSWFLNPDGTPSDAFKADMVSIGTPIGGILFMPVPTIPDGYLVANGQAVSRTTYANLFALYGTRFGTGDGSTTFNLPDLQKKFLLGAKSEVNYQVGNTGGEETHTLLTAEMPAHTHPPLDPATNIGSAEGTGNDFHTVSGGTVGTNGVVLQSATTGSTGDDQPHNNMPPFMAGLWLVKF